MALELDYVLLVLYCCIIGVVLFISYKNTNENEREYQLTLIILFFLVLSVLLAPNLFVWFLFLGILIIFLNIITFAMTHLFTKIEDRLLIDEKPQIWDTFEEAPELKQSQ